MLFGLERVGHRLHFFATAMVAVGTLISAFWILSAIPGCRRRPATPSTLPGNSSPRLAQRDLQSVVSLPPRAYGAAAY